jgi:hypothetical protein
VEKSPFHDLIVTVQEIRQRRDPAPLFGDLTSELLDGEYHFTTSEATLTFMSRRIENACFTDPHRCTLYSVFRRLSLLEPHLDHYHKLSQVAQHIYIIGVPDLELRPWAPNVHLLTKRAEQLARNWITIALSRDIHMTLLAEELPPEGDARRYVGFYTDSHALTRRVIRQLMDMAIIKPPELFAEEALDQPPPPEQS